MKNAILFAVCGLALAACAGISVAASAPTEEVQRVPVDAIAEPFATYEVKAYHAYCPELSAVVSEDAEAARVQRVASILPHAAALVGGVQRLESG